MSCASSGIHLLWVFLRHCIKRCNFRYASFGAPNWLWNYFENSTPPFVNGGIELCRSSHRRYYIRKSVKNFAIFKRKQLCQSFYLIELQPFRTSTLLKNRLQHMCIPIPRIFKSINKRLLLYNALNVCLGKSLESGEYAMKPLLDETWQNHVPDSSPDEILPAKTLLLKLTQLSPSFCEQFPLYKKLGSNFFHSILKWLKRG